MWYGGNVKRRQFLQVGGAGLLLPAAGAVLGSGMQQALLMISGGSPDTKLGTSVVFPASTFTITGATYSNMLDGSGGSTITQTYAKVRSDTSMLVSIGATLQYTGAGLVTLGVSDGLGTDYDVCTFVGAATYRPINAQKLITGLAIQTLTFTARSKITAGTASFNTLCSGFLRVMEVIEL